MATSIGDQQEYVHVGQIVSVWVDRMRFCRCMYLREDLIISSHLWTQLRPKKPTAQGAISNPENWAMESICGFQPGLQSLLRLQ